MNKLSSSQAEQIKEIGTYLRQKRLEKSLTLEDIAADTMIRLPMLQALEEGSLERLPELIYIKGFIRRYAEALKMDGQALANTLFQVMETPAADPLSLDRSKPSAVQSPPIKENTTPTPPPAAAVKPTASSINPYWIYLLLGIGGLLCGLWYFLSRPPAPETAIQTSPSPPVISPQAEFSPATSTVVEKTQPKPSVAISPSPAISKVQPPVPKTSPSPKISPSPVAEEEKEIPLSVTVKLDEKSWLKIVVDGKTEYVGILEPGEQKTWTAKKSLSIRAGNAGAVKLSVNEKPAQTLGKAGEVKEVTLTSKASN